MSVLRRRVKAPQAFTHSKNEAVQGSATSSRKVVRDRITRDVTPGVPVLVVSKEERRKLVMAHLGEGIGKVEIGSPIT